MKVYELYANYIYYNLSDVGQIFKDLAGMEWKMEGTPEYTEPQEEHIASLEADGHTTFYSSSSTTMAPRSTPVSPEKAMGSNERVSSGGCFNLLTISD